jgi:hypothetical protein
MRVSLSGRVLSSGAPFYGFARHRCLVPELQLGSADRRM